MTSLAIPFDSFEYFECLKDAGVPELQAKAQTAALQQAFQAYDENARKVFVTESSVRHATSKIRADLRDELVTKGDLREESIAIRADLRNETNLVRADLRETELRLETKIESTKAELKAEIAASKHEMLKWVMGMLVAQTGVLVALYAIMR